MKKGDAVWLLKLKHAKQIKALKNQLRQVKMRFREENDELSVLERRRLSKAECRRRCHIIEKLGAVFASATDSKEQEIRGLGGRTDGQNSGPQSVNYRCISQRGPRRQSTTETVSLVSINLTCRFRAIR